VLVPKVTKGYVLLAGVREKSKKDRARGVSLLSAKINHEANEGGRRKPPQKD
jgi:hypothetical protein